MKNYTLSLFVFVFIFGLFNINFTSAANCATGDLFDSATGARCNTNTAIVECPKGDIFDTTTGERCVAWRENSSNSVTYEFQMGARGENVKIFQRMLVSNGFLFGKVDGIYGPITDGAAKSYYQKYPRSVVPPEPCPLSIDASGVITHVCPPVSGSPVVYGVSGPQSLALNETGTWTVTAYNPNGGNLSYSVVWGDEGYQYGSSASLVRPAPQQTATFTHRYTYSGIFKPSFTVTNSSGQSTQTSLSVNVNAIQSSGNLQIYPSSATIKVGGTITLQATLNTCPAGAQCFVGPIPVQATWTSNNTKVASVVYENTCASGTYCLMVAPNNLKAVVTGLSAGTATITATYQKSPSGPLLMATTLIKVEGTINDAIPKISYLSPSSGAVGTRVNIYGTGLSDSTIYFGGYPVDSSSVDSADDGKKISFVVPTNLNNCYGVQMCTMIYRPIADGKYDVYVTNKIGKSNSVVFVVTGSNLEM